MRAWERSTEPPAGEYSFLVQAEDAGRRLDEFLELRFPWLSRMRLRATIACGNCWVNGERADRGRRLHAGDAVRIWINTLVPTGMWPEPLPVEVLYEDAWLAVVLKPAGMLIHPTRKVKTGTLANALAWLWNPQLRNLERPQPAGPAIRPGFPHRLDREASGLLIVAKNQMTLRRLAQAFRRREVDKRYTAIVAGCVASDALEVHAGIGRVPGEKPYWRAVENGKAATTRLRVLKRRAGLSLVELEPLTGRTHQLRIHCAHIGHPILGDNLYGGPPAPRLCLHATSVALRHPETGRLLRFGSEPPGDMQACFVDTGQEPCNLF